MRVNLGYPEVITACGTLMILNHLTVAGWIFCALGLIGVIIRFGIRVQEQQEKKKELQDLSGQISSAGKNVLSLVQAFSNNDKSDFH